ncbi:MAG: putative lipid II flippase FtsW [Cellulomonadaceae bacterium]|jgi:cell division protein FtsW|nr:putative lipid II flippase FtsW [Cellulomonadaceae bacterium]
MASIALPNTLPQAPPTPAKGQPSPTTALKALGERALADKMGSDAALMSYYLLCATTALLAILGLVMVLSSSTVSSIHDGKSPYSQFLVQGMYALIGLVTLFICTRVNLKVYRGLAWFALLLAMGLQVLTFIPGFALSAGGNTGWVLVPGTSYVFQPAEFGKPALALWLGAILGKRHTELYQWRKAFFPALGAGAYIVLVLVGHDLGTALVFLILVFAAFFIAGVPGKLLGLIGGAAAAVIGYVFIFQQGSGNRLARIAAAYNPNCDKAGDCFQALHGRFALATGGIFGVGLGGSREKWNYLPEAHNDFIFAIIGEELGLMGTLMVLGLFVALGVAMARVVVRHPDPMVKITTAAVAAWIIGQALINIAVVVGIVPVIGLPLPLISSGGSALITTMAALGIVMSFSRSEPLAPEALAARPKILKRGYTVVSRSRAARVRKQRS